MDTTRNAPMAFWLVAGGALGIALLAMVGAALVGLLPWFVPFVAWLLASALVPALTLLRRPAPALVPQAGD